MTPPQRSVRQPEVVGELIGHLLPAARTPLQVEPLAGGYHNTVVRVRDGGAVDWVVKQYVVGSTNPMFPQLHDHEAAALVALAGADVAPTRVAYLPDAEVGPVLVYEFVAGEIWHDDLDGAAEVLDRAHRASRLDDRGRVDHTGRIDVAGHRWRTLLTSSDDLCRHAESMVTGSMVTGSMVGGARGDAAEQVRRAIARVPASDAASRCLVHTDAGPGNMVQTADGVRLIDWQCPGVGDPVEDLVAFVSPAIQILYGRTPLGPDARERFLAAYGGSVVASFARRAPAYHVRIAAYCAFRASELASSSPEVSARYDVALSAELAHLEDIT